MGLIHDPKAMEGMRKLAALHKAQIEYMAQEMERMIQANKRVENGAQIIDANPCRMAVRNLKSILLQQLRDTGLL